MKKITILRSGFFCLLAMILMLQYTGIVSYAEEDDGKELSFNSVVEVETYSIEEGYIAAGKEANVILTLRNANKYSAASNITVIVSSNSGMVYPTYGNDNQFFIGNMAANSVTNLSIPLVVNSQFKGDYADLTCTITYVTNGRQITNSSTMILPAQGRNTIAVNALDVGSHATINVKSLLSIGYYNKSTENINDAVLIVDGNVSESTRIIELGTVSSGKSYTKDCNVVFTQAGEQSITVRMRYTDFNGDLVETDLGTFNVKVEQDKSIGAVDGEANGILVWGGRVIAVLAFLAVLFVAIRYIIKR